MSGRGVIALTFRAPGRARGFQYEVRLNGRWIGDVRRDGSKWLAHPPSMHPVCMDKFASRDAAAEWLREFAEGQRGA
jgi:hypothetical protein